MPFRHLMVYVSDFRVSREFYDHVLGFAGYSVGHETDVYCMWDPETPGCSFGIVRAEKGRYVQGESGFRHLAFSAGSRSIRSAGFSSRCVQRCRVGLVNARSIVRLTTRCILKIQTG
jgi:catechol 2,3-dioxygenase-like lactoylglutathione lyase family enzyme